MTPRTKHSENQPVSQSEFHRYMHEQMRSAIRVTLSSILEEELTAFIGAGRYEQKSERRDHRNGSYTRDLVTSVGKIEGLAVPRSRGGYQTQVFERYHRRQTELDTAMLQMFVGGVSTQQVGGVIHEVTGQQPSASTVSRVFHTLEAEYAVWKNRRLASHYQYVFADGTYFTVIYEAKGIKMAVLAVVGINLAGEREVLGFTTGDRENEQAWTDLLEQFKQRGLQTVGLWITDGNQAMLNAIERKFPTAQRQRCVLHKMKNVLGYLPKQQHAAIEPELKAIFYQDNREQADQLLAAFCAKYQKSYPTAIECLCRDSEACLTFYNFPKEHWKTIRTNNVSERLFEDVRRAQSSRGQKALSQNECRLSYRK